MESLIVERQGGVATVTMNRPDRLNAINGTMLRELFDVFTEVERTVGDRVMILTGAGGAFCSGADLADAEGPASKSASRSDLTRLRRLGDVALALHRVTKPTIAKVDGHAVGAGLSLALGCDLIVCSDRAELSTIFSRRGLSLDNGASWLLPRLVGLARAKEIALFGGRWGAEDAMAVGLVNRVLPAAEIDVFVADWAATLAAGPPMALSMTKTLLNGSMQASMEQAVENEARCGAVNFASVDTGEAMAAFSEKREPNYVGR